MSLLRNSDFQRLLQEYKRKPRVFYVAHAAEDEVSSEWLVRGLDGKEYKPDDYSRHFPNTSPHTNLTSTRFQFS